MVIFNEKYKFAFNMNEPYKELKREGYSILGINDDQAERVLHAFVALDSSNRIKHTILLMKDATYSNESEYKKAIDQNIVNMVRMGYKILNSYHMTFTNGRTAEKVIYEVNGKKLCFIVAGVHGILVGSSTVIQAEGDEYDKELSSVFASMTEF